MPVISFITLSCQNNKRIFVKDDVATVCKISTEHCEHSFALLSALFNKVLITLSTTFFGMFPYAVYAVLKIIHADFKRMIH